MAIRIYLLILLKGLSTQGGDPPLLFPNSEKKQNSFKRYLLSPWFSSKYNSLSVYNSIRIVNKNWRPVSITYMRGFYQRLSHQLFLATRSIDGWFQSLSKVMRVVFPASNGCLVHPLARCTSGS